MAAFSLTKRGENQPLRPQISTPSFISAGLPLWEVCRRQLTMSMIDVRASYCSLLATGKAKGPPTRHAREFYLWIFIIMLSDFGDK